MTLAYSRTYLISWAVEEGVWFNSKVRANYRLLGQMPSRRLEVIGRGQGRLFLDSETQKLRILFSISGSITIYSKFAFCGILEFAMSGVHFLWAISKCENRAQVSEASSLKNGVKTVFCYHKISRSVIFF
jgi:hypothetical protein